MGDRGAALAATPAPEPEPRKLLAVTPRDVAPCTAPAAGAARFNARAGCAIIKFSVLLDCNPPGCSACFFFSACLLFSAGKIMLCDSDRARGGAGDCGRP